MSMSKQKYAIWNKTIQGLIGFDPMILFIWNITGLKKQKNKNQQTTKRRIWYSSLGLMQKADSVHPKKRS